MHSKRNHTQNLPRLKSLYLHPNIYAFPYQEEIEMLINYARVLPLYIIHMSISYNTVPHKYV